MPENSHGEVMVKVGATLKSSFLWTALSSTYHLCPSRIDWQETQYSSLSMEAASPGDLDQSLSEKGL